MLGLKYRYINGKICAGFFANNYEPDIKDANVNICPSGELIANVEFKFKNMKDMTL